MIAIDSSVSIAAFASWHEAHRIAREAVASGARPVAHALLETYSVLTRLPAPHRAPAEAIGEFVESAFPKAPLLPSGDLQARLVHRLIGFGITGGPAYDALIALTAAEANATLLSLDRRAAETYRRCGVDFELLTS